MFHLSPSRGAQGTFVLPADAASPAASKKGSLLTQDCPFTHCRTRTQFSRRHLLPPRRRTVRIPLRKPNRTEIAWSNHTLSKLRCQKIECPFSKISAYILNILYITRARAQYGVLLSAVQSHSAGLAEFGARVFDGSPACGTVARSRSLPHHVYGGSRGEGKGDELVVHPARVFLREGK